jgi:hypothetical protein
VVDLTVSPGASYLAGPQSLLAHNCPTSGSGSLPRDARGRFTTGAGGESAATKAGRDAHKDWGERLEQEGGWKVDQRLDGNTRMRADGANPDTKLIRELKAACEPPADGVFGSTAVEKELSERLPPGAPGPAS